MLRESPANLSQRSIKSTDTPLSNSAQIDLKCPLQLSELQQLLRIYSTPSTAHGLQSTLLSKEIGVERAEEVARSPEYRQELLDHYQALTRPIGDTPVVLAVAPSLKELALSHQLFGSDLGPLLASVQPFVDGQPLPFSADTKSLLTFHAKTVGHELLGSVTMRAFYRCEKEVMELEHLYECSHKEDEQTSAIFIEKKAFLSVMQIPPAFQGQCLAAQLLRAQLRTCEKGGVQALALHANNDIGGYAWAVFGFGWDLEEMVPEDVETTIESARRNVYSCLRATGLIDNADRVQATPYTRTVQKIIDLFAHEPEEPISPQVLAELGSTGPFFYKGPDAQWRVAPSFEEARAEAKHINKAGCAYHLGKIALLGSNWHGIIELRRSGSQGGENLFLLEQALAERLDH